MEWWLPRPGGREIMGVVIFNEYGTSVLQDEELWRSVSQQYEYTYQTISNTLATWCKEPIHCNRPWCWERLKAEGNDRGWDGWMASPTQRTWVWANSGRQRKTRKPGTLQSMGRKESDMTERLNNWTIHLKMAEMVKKQIIRVFTTISLYIQV